MNKIIVIGCPGGGKSTFARELHNICNLPLYHLDMLYWNADRTTVSSEVFNERLKEVLNHNKWIIDGNFNSTLEMRMEACDTIFFLDYEASVCAEGVLSRQGKARSDLPWIEEEIDEEFMDFIARFAEESRPHIVELLNKYSNKQIITFKTREESQAYLQELKQSYA